jgi:hypothetical protein
MRGTDTEHITGYQCGGWYCDCAAYQHGRRCSHLAALQLICAAQPGRFEEDHRMTIEALAERVRRPPEPHTWPCGRQWTAASDADLRRARRDAS